MPMVGAVCVYPTMVAHAVKALDGSGIPVASVGPSIVSIYGRELKLHKRDETTVLDVPALAIDNPITYFLDCIKTGKTPEGIGDPEIAADACRILDAAIKSNETGKAEVP